MNSAFQNWNDLAEYWDNRSGEFGSQSQRTLIFPVIQSILTRAVRLSNVRILDIGCGNGWLSRLLAVNDAYVTGIDPSSRMIELAQSHCINNPSYARISFTESTIESFAYVYDGTPFDVAISVMTTHSVDDLESFFMTVSRLLGSDGLFVICVEHPFFSINQELTRDHNREWIGVSKELAVRDFAFYEMRKKQKIQWTDNRSSTNNFRPLQDYTNFLRRSGFLLRDIWEITDSFIQDNNMSIIYPKFMILEATYKGEV